MSVLEYGTYLESNTKIVELRNPYYTIEDFQEYVEVLDYLRNSGCTITPRAFIPEHNPNPKLMYGIMWLYVPSEHTSQETFMKFDKSDPRVLIQIISSLRNMYYIDCDFNVLGYMDIMNLIHNLDVTKENIAITTHMQDMGEGKRKHELGDVTVLNVPYCMMTSSLFDKPCISKYKDSFLCLELIPMILMIRYRKVIELGRHTLDPKEFGSTYDIISHISSLSAGPEKTMYVEDYLEFAEYALRDAMRGMRQIESYDSVYRDIPEDLIVASQDSVIVF